MQCQAERLGCKDQVVQLKVGGSASAFTGEPLDFCRECFTGANINNQSKSLYDIHTVGKDTITSSLLLMIIYSCTKRYSYSQANLHIYKYKKLPQHIYKHLHDSKSYCYNHKKPYSSGHCLHFLYFDKNFEINWNEKG